MKIWKHIKRLGLGAMLVSAFAGIAAGVEWVVNHPHFAMQIVFPVFIFIVLYLFGVCLEKMFEPTSLRTKSYPWEGWR